jgi:hypothetical protein
MSSILFNVYMPIRNMEKIGCWESFRAHKGKFQLNDSIVVGDFNTMLSSKEKRWGSVVRDPMRETMEDLISDWDSVDVKPTKGKYAWSNKRLDLGHIATHLNIFLLHSDLFLRDTIISSQRILSKVFNHKHIIVSFNP